MDEADLLALLENEGGNSPITCSCTEKCSAGTVNTACPICSTNMSECAGKEAAPADPEPVCLLYTSFTVMGAAERALDGQDRLEVLHGIMHPDGERFSFDWNWLAPSGLSTKDFIAPSSFAFKNSRMFQMGGKLCAASFLQIITPELNDHVLTDFLDTDSGIVVNLHVQALGQREVCPYRSRPGQLFSVPVSSWRRDCLLYTSRCV